MTTSFARPTLSHPPSRVVSLVPSITESLFDLGLGAAVVGVTDYCIHPAQALAGLPRVGGPQNPRIETILALRPDLVIANQEENDRRSVEELQAAGLVVWITFPRTVQQAVNDLWELVNLFGSKVAAQKLQAMDRLLDWLRSATAGQPTVRYFCPIWQARTEEGRPWWMTFNQDTYCHDLLQILGGENVFAGRQRCNPLAADLGLQPAEDSPGLDTRYPRLALEEILSADPELILLPSEPFAYHETHRRELQEIFAATQAARNDRIRLIDGALLTWHGTRLARALNQLPDVLLIV